MLGDGDRAMDLFAMLNPANKARNAGDVARYRSEPYVVAADVYSNPAHIGEAAGLGTRGSPRGCIASGSNRFSG